MSNPDASYKDGVSNQNKVPHESSRVFQTESDSGINRRSFMGWLGAAGAVASIGLANPALASAQSTETSSASATLPASVTSSRVRAAFNLRVSEALRDALIGPAVNVTNGDEARYNDKGGTFTKGLPHDSFGRVDLTAFASFKRALNSGRFSDFENIIVGGTRTLNGPQGGLTFDLAGLDEVQFGQPIVPPAPTASGDLNATELLELYWCSLLRDVAFTDYGSSALVAQAAAELGAQPSYQGPRTHSGQVTPDLVGRGGFPGETLGPYISQFFLHPANFGAQPLSQQMVTYLPNIDYLTNFGDWLTVQNGNVTGHQTQTDPQLKFQYNGRSLGAYTRVDVLFQAYFTAMLVLGSIGAPLNPGNPYIGSTTENGFDTFGGPDIAGTVCEVATRALHAVWYQKWMVHLRPRPETMGGIAHLLKTGQGNRTDVTLSNIVLNSHGLQRSFNKYGTWLLSQAFPEGSPMHPAYPTGHGTVGGACITVLKYFFDGNFVIPNPLVPSNDGLSTAPYTGPDADRLTVNGELNKVGHNVSFGHGIHSGIHWRSDTDTSLLLGEAVALAFLRDKARTFNEPFTVSLTKFDGTTATISNHGNP